MQFDKLAGTIHNIGLDPFYVHYWGNSQLNVYRAYAVSEPACVYIDATGTIVKKKFGNQIILIQSISFCIIV